jgi:hypothetical protein
MIYVQRARKSAFTLVCDGGIVDLAGRNDPSEPERSALDDRFLGEPIRAKQSAQNTVASARISHPSSNTDHVHVHAIAHKS